MAKKQEIAFNSLNVDFPEKAYMAYIVAQEGGRGSKVYPLTPIFYTLDEVAFYIRESEEHFLESEEYSIQETGLLIPLHKDRLLPLKEEYWYGPTEHFDGLDRMRLFMGIPPKYQMYKLLVTPSGMDDEQNIFLDAVLPVLYSAPDRLIEGFLKTSDYPVLESAREVAIYSLGTPFRFNWQTEEISLASYPPESHSEPIN